MSQPGDGRNKNGQPGIVDNYKLFEFHVAPPTPPLLHHSWTHGAWKHAQL